LKGTRRIPAKTSRETNGLSWKGKGGPRQGPPWQREYSGPKGQGNRVQGLRKGTPRGEGDWGGGWRKHRTLKGKRGVNRKKKGLFEEGKVQKKKRKKKGTKGKCGSGGKRIPRKLRLRGTQKGFDYEKKRDFLQS